MNNTLPIETLETGYQDANPKITWWKNPAGNPGDQAWRDYYQKTLSWMTEGPSSPYAIEFAKTVEINRLVCSLVHTDADNNCDPEDRAHILYNLGRLLAQRPGTMGEGMMGAEPLSYFVSDLFCAWTKRACLGSLARPVDHEPIEWKRGLIGQRDMHHHWIHDLIRKATKDNTPYISEVGYMAPWHRLRPGMETFLDGWQSGVGPEVMARRAATRTSQSAASVCCLAMRSLASLTPRIIPQATAERLCALEAWMGPGAIKLDHELVISQQVAWDGYLLDREVIRLTKKQKNAAGEVVVRPRARKM